MTKAKLPVQVLAIKYILDQNPSDSRFEIAQKLIGETHEHISMWKSLERRREDPDDLWVWSFLTTASNASVLPPYHYMTAVDRNELSDRIQNLSKELSRTLKAYELEFQIIQNDGKIFDGFFIFEDFGESNQQRIESANTKKLPVLKILEGIAERTKRIIAEEPLHGKAGKNVKAVRFIRIMASRNHILYGTPLNKVIATAANFIFDTNYSSSDIRKLLSR